LNQTKPATKRKRRRKKEAKEKKKENIFFANMYNIVNIFVYLQCKLRIFLMKKHVKSSSHGQN